MSRPVSDSAGAGVSGGDGGGVKVEVGEVADLSQRLAILQAKRADDKSRIKELERYKAQYAQVRCTRYVHT